MEPSAAPCKILSGGTFAYFFICVFVNGILAVHGPGMGLSAESGGGSTQPTMTLPRSTLHAAACSLRGRDNCGSRTTLEGRRKGGAAPAFGSSDGLGVLRRPQATGDPR